MGEAFSVAVIKSSQHWHLAATRPHTSRSYPPIFAHFVSLQDGLTDGATAAREQSGRVG